VFGKPLRHAIWRSSIGAALGLRAVMAIAAPATNGIRIDSVASKYAIHDYSFEVNPETGRAGIRLEYDYPPALVGYDDTGDQGPAPRITVLPGLTYDAAAHAVVYTDGATRVTCATAASRRTLFGKSAYMKPTGACAVSSRLTDHARDNGWSIDRFRTLDTYFVLQQK
jgi:hypothetical protein